MKKCEVCGLVSEPTAETCPACGEASWCAAPVEEAKAPSGELFAPAPVAPSGKRGGR